jgi:site-specific DNA-methyltransferase (adenine-specific)
MNYELDVPNIGGGLEMLRSLRTGIVSCVFLDPQFRGVLDQLGYGNEGARQSERAALPQMSDKLIRLFLAEIERVLRPSHYCAMWCDKHALCSNTYATPGMPTVDMIVWKKPRMGMGYRTRRVSEYLLIKQKSPIEAKATWTDHGIPDVWPEEPSGDHPHAKPLELQRRLIAAVTQSGDVVVDPCAGSYSVMRAAHACGRKFLGTDVLKWEGANGLPLERPS